MRSQTTGMVTDLAGHFERAFTLEMFRRGSFTRQFESQVKRAYDNKQFAIPIYLCLGQEFNSAALSMAFPGCNIFAQHRCHGIYLAFGGIPERLRDELCGLPSGCSGGMSGSNAIQSPEARMFGHSGLMGEQIPIAVGAALASRHPTLAICGDASVEEDYIYPSLGYAVKQKLPVLFVCEDNGLSILTPVAVRRNWSPVDVARAVGMPAVEITDDPWLIAHHAQQLARDLPAFINIQTVRNVWHAGTGCDGAPEWDRYALIREQMLRLDLAREVEAIEQETAEQASTIWAKRPQRQYAQSRANT